MRKWFRGLFLHTPRFKVLQFKSRANITGDTVMFRPFLGSPLKGSCRRQAAEGLYVGYGSVLSYLCLLYFEHLKCDLKFYSLNRNKR